ncbi:MAG: ATP-binding protein, partial [Clostridia bacterium]|nr:ATP-binding protein [Clostridia bacterium]
IQLHTIEDKLSLMLKETENITGEEFIRFVKCINFDEMIDKDLGIIKDFLGNGFFQSEKNISINYERIESLLKIIEDRFIGDDKSFLISNISKLADSKLSDLLMGYNEYIQTLALRFDKMISDIEVKGDIVYINRQYYSKFLKSMIHIFRNIVDHAIEPPEERIEKDKNEQGKIVCHISQYDDCFVIEISDDGKGIHPNTVLNKALEKGIYQQEEISCLGHSDIINTIFLDSFSTKDKVSTLSGRGVGLAAVRSEVEALRGSIEVISKVNKGTTFKITLPETKKNNSLCLI